jgi:hypothetical protein
LATTPYRHNRIKIHAHRGIEVPTAQPKSAPVVAKETTAAIHTQNNSALKTARKGINKAAPTWPP